MFIKPSPLEVPVDLALNPAILALADLDPKSKEYDAVLGRVTRLYQLKIEAEKPRRQRVSPDTLIAAAVNLLGIALIIRHEHVNILTSKALGFVPRIR